MKAKQKTIIGRINSVFPSCKEVTMLIIKEQEITLSFSEKAKLIFHTAMCSFCRVFKKQSTILHEHIHKRLVEEGSESIPFSLSEKDKNAMQTLIDNEQNKNERN
jgi:hypothetical protein